jgi:hypothetical protein
MALKKEVVRAWLGNVPEGHVFWCHDGRMLKNLEELAGALGGMSEETYRHHVTGGGNDFSNWVRDVVGDVALANQLKKALSLGAAARAASARLNWLRERQ